ELAIANEELTFQNSEKEKRADELAIANKELAFQNSEKQKRADELAIANEELTFQNSEKEKRADELAIANKELAFQNSEKQKRAEELAIANEELTFQNSQKEKRAAELVLANKELVFQNSEKEKRAAELSVANRELAFQNLQKEKRAAELIVANKELAFQNSEKEKRADELIVANRELAFQNNEKRKQAEELIILNDKLLAQSLEKENSASAFIIANEELIFRKKRAEELITTNKELAFQNLEKGRLTTELVIANKELAFQNSEKEKRADELEITHKRSEKLNSSVNHLQKVESIGRLTAGISHDFNNILACMLGYNEINTEIISDINDNLLKTEIENNTKQIASAGQRAVMLIDKMMIYARQDTPTANVINVRPTSEIIEEVLEMLRPALTSRVKLEFDNNSNKNNGKPNNKGSNLPIKIEINAIDLYQILTNLAVNARDAMKNQIGFIRISLRHVVMSEVHCIACAAIMNGDFIELAVTDNGTGIDPKLIRRIFDPFFTTKQVGEGTGLGLSTTMGLVHSANGHIMIDSALTGISKGTSFKLLFPVPVID
ncbi:MAG: ATP-binding protein, partial [Methylococcales bacterium]|nr:ATP-binding protein [Methylococcales bacterium]